MFDFNKPNIEIAEISDDKKYGRFVVEPLERGYGTTLGNSLRRIMLSSLPGAAISQIKIDGVLHEFSSIPGVKEDVTEIIMNLKTLAIKNSSGSTMLHVRADKRRKKAADGACTSVFIFPSGAKEEKRKCGEPAWIFLAADR